jgi:CheY-like chemotaxis protein
MIRKSVMYDYKPVVILLVEDDPGDQKLVKQSFTREHIANELIVVNCMEKAMEYLERSRCGHKECPMPDLILLDLNMPGMGGRELLKAIKVDPEFDVVPVVILTSSDSEEDIMESFRLQAAGYVRKPITLEGFQKAITDLTDYWFVVCKHVEPSRSKKSDCNICIVN